MALRFPRVKNITITNPGQAPATATVSLGSYLNRIVYTDILDAAASTLELDLVVGSSISSDVYTKLQFQFGWSKDGSTFDPIEPMIDTNVITIDRDVDRYGEDMNFMSGLAYNYGLDIGQYTGEVADDGKTNANQVSYGGITGGGVKSVSYIIQDIRNYFNFGLIGVAGAETAGTSSTTFDPAYISASTYLEMLKKLAKMYGYAFNIKPATSGNNGNLFFNKYFGTLDSAAAIATLTPASLVQQGEFTRNYDGVKRTIKIKYKVFVPGGGPVGTDRTDGYLMTAVDPRIPSTNQEVADLQTEGYQEDLTAARSRLEGALIELNGHYHTAHLVTEGNSQFVAGNNITLSGFGTQNSGTYQITKAVHTLDATQGWICELSIRKIITVNPATIYTVQKL
ncbi:MAG: hypothetical protein KME46_25740 [Brasilonema angustatum HA4187-MV1]|jgi:hypothetical protein|nr:hypothetical protein [Brasilonema angustatum HA4187-MV1]